MNAWPQVVRNDLDANYFAQASEQIGTNVTNDFISGPLHEALRQVLFNGIQGGSRSDPAQSVASASSNTG
jgi:hypothetical protein